MFDPTKHKTIKRFNHPRTGHELTWSCFHQRSLLSTPERRTLVVDAIRNASERHGYAVLAFVVMPNHVHLLVRHAAEHDVSALLFAIKRPSSFRLKQMMSEGEQASLVVHERPGKTAFRFWQEGPGYDRNIGDDTINDSIRYLHLNPVRKGLCRRAAEWEWSSASWYAREALRADGGIDWER
ncbi:MAG TPA: transposase [Phycisphaerales bacterium]|nr:transposase [Phycisphaerales bacterium]